MNQKQSKNQKKFKVPKKVDLKEQDLPGLVRGRRGEWNKRVLIFSPTRGMVRMEWVQARYGQIVPTNWSHVEIKNFLSPYLPIEYQLGDAQNLMARTVVEGDYEWVLYIEDDNIIPPNGFWKMNNYINQNDTPVVSGLYFTKSNPPEPLIYRGRGNSYYKDWKVGEKVWCDGIPFGFRLEHASLIKAAWAESPEYMVGAELTRRVFDSPNKMWYDSEKGGVVATQGTTDLAWCTRIIDDKLFEKAGWPEYQKKEFPFLVDTTIYVKHITDDGTLYPREFPVQYMPDDSKENFEKAIKILRWEI